MTASSTARLLLPNGSNDRRTFGYLRSILYTDGYTTSELALAPLQPSGLIVKGNRPDLLPVAAIKSPFILTADKDTAKSGAVFALIGEVLSSG